MSSDEYAIRHEPRPVISAQGVTKGEQGQPELFFRGFLDGKEFDARRRKTRAGRTSWITLGDQWTLSQRTRISIFINKIDKQKREGTYKWKRKLKNP